MPKLQSYTIEFQLEGVPKSYTLETNIETYGQSVYAAFNNWTVRTKEFTLASFCEYVESKDPNFICKPIEEK